MTCLQMSRLAELVISIRMSLVPVEIWREKASWLHFSKNQSKMAGDGLLTLVVSELESGGNEMGWLLSSLRYGNLAWSSTKLKYL